MKPTAEKLHRNPPLRSLYEELFEQSVDGILVISEGKIIRANPAFCRLHGFNLTEIVGRDPLQLVQPEDREAAMSQLTELFDGESRAASYTYRAVHRDGHILQMRVSSRRVSWSGRRVIQTIVRDVTEAHSARSALDRSERRYQSLFDSIPIGLYRTTPEGTIIDANPTLVKMLGYPDRQTLLRTSAEEAYLQKETRGQLKETIEQEEVVQGYEALWRRYDGSPLWVEEHVRAIREESGRVLYYEGSAEDVSARKEAERALAEARTKVERLHEAAAALARAETEDVVFQVAVDAADHILGYSHCTLDVERNGFLITEATSRETPAERLRHAQIEDAGVAGRVYQTQETCIVDDVGEAGAVEASSLPIRSMITAPIQRVGVFQSVSEEAHAFSAEDARFLDILLGHTAAAVGRLRLHTKLMNQATHDALTEVYNRRYFNEVIEQETLRATRYRHPLGLLMIDINRFKEINDRRGHQAGDAVLKRIAKILKNAVRETDIIVRYGGDEFLVALTETGEEAAQVAERIRTSVAHDDTLHGIAGFPLSVSVGTITWSPDSGTPVEHILTLADERMYAEKRSIAT
jgi:diguanylate cyclase (GGDEF)-like protein/PAS domain S-box-containing protein